MLMLGRIDKEKRAASLRIKTDRLLLLPFTYAITVPLLRGDHSELAKAGIQAAEGWPDQDMIETLPKILRNLELAGGEPSGFESWLVLENDSLQIIGDVGFKGKPNAQGEVDIGYAVIESKRRSGIASEAAMGLVEWAFGDPAVQAITAKCLIDNAASARTLVRMGFREIARDSEYISWKLERAWQ